MVSNLKGTYYKFLIEGRMKGPRTQDSQSLIKDTNQAEPLKFVSALAMTARVLYRIPTRLNH